MPPFRSVMSSPSPLCLFIYLSIYRGFCPRDSCPRPNHSVHFAGEVTSLPPAERKGGGRCNRTESGPSPFPNAMPPSDISINPYVASVGRRTKGNIWNASPTSVDHYDQSHARPLPRPPTASLPRSRSLCGRQRTIQCRVRSDRATKPFTFTARCDRRAGC